MAERNFSSILDMQASEVERPKPLPVGSYTAVVDGRYKEDVSPQKKTPYVEFTMKVLSAGEDVDEDALNEALTKPSGEKAALNSKSLRATFYTTEDAIWRLKKFLEDLGLDVEGKSFRQCLDETPGCQCTIVVAHQQSQDGEATFANIKGTAKA